ncbi:MBL fold metallo-hydrolase [Halorhabdus rudnickae]|uniref:MBL fold metallo-hydrolase n=1 Tax=Halorhabdus rudnickae TaxID=1775544 RepID=UPI00108341CB|nr:MBL fold metallo-hydrolase [Halorhabdus rudnickae]
MSTFEITPRGGADEVGRSCYHVQADDRDYFVDCGIKQAQTAEFPTFRGIGPGQIDGVFITHAHIDHIGALPVAEKRGLLADDASIVMTRPTNALTGILLHDSLQIHKQEAEELGRPQEFTSDDVERVLDRVTSVGYDRDHYLNVTYEFGDAAHLLGSAWLVLEFDDRRVVFSGDLGGRSAHLGDIDEPPEADELVLESTYGDTMQHRSFSDARTEVYKRAKQAHADGIPVLIPTFAVGRAQEILQLFREREDDLRGAVDGEPSIVYDGMITESMSVYEVFCQDEFMGESITNYRINSNDAEPFTPDCAWTPETMEERERLLDGESAPIIVAPSGMLTGGWSPYYLRDLARHYDQARVLFIGYQAEGTPGRAIQDTPGDVADVTITALPAAEDYDSETDEFGFQEQEIRVPTAWVHEIGGMSGHAAANDLLEFARGANPLGISLVHGPPAAAAHLREYLDDNTEAEAVQTASHLEAIEVGKSDVITPDVERLLERQDRLEEELASLREDIEAVTNRQ